MNLKRVGNFTNGARHRFCIDKSDISKKKIVVRKLRFGLKRRAGRCRVSGKITVRHKGGSGQRKLFSYINSSSQLKLGLFLTVSFDPCRNAFLGLYYDFFYQKFFTCLFTEKTYPGSLIFSYLCLPKLQLGALVSIKKLVSGLLIHSVAYNLHSLYARAAGTSCIIIELDSLRSKIKLPSGKIKLISLDQSAILGSINNNYSNLVVLGKAGASRRKGRRPSVRGVAMNPVDHPHGGRTKGGIPSVTPWSLPTKNFKLAKK